MQAGYGGPPPFMAPPPQKKSRAWIYIVGSIVVVLLIACVGGIFALRALGNAASTAVNKLATQVATSVPTTVPVTGTDITKVKLGKGDDQGNITTETTSFTESDTIVIDYTATSTTSGDQVALKIIASDGTELTGGPSPQDLDSGTHDYFFAVQITGKDSYTAELLFNGNVESNLNFTVS